jgi:hypothetical protein
MGDPDASDAHIGLTRQDRLHVLLAMGDTATLNVDEVIGLCDRLVDAKPTGCEGSSASDLNRAPNPRPADRDTRLGESATSRNAAVRSCQRRRK